MQEKGNILVQKGTGPKKEGEEKGMSWGGVGIKMGPTEKKKNKKMSIHCSHFHREKSRKIFSQGKIQKNMFTISRLI